MWECGKPVIVITLKRVLAIGFSKRLCVNSKSFPRLCWRVVGCISIHEPSMKVSGVAFPCFSYRKVRRSFTIVSILDLRVTLAAIPVALLGPDNKYSMICGSSLSSASALNCSNSTSSRFAI